MAKKRSLKESAEDAVLNTDELHWVLRYVHPASATAMTLGAIGGAIFGWRLFLEVGLFTEVIAAVVGGFFGAWVGLLMYWLIRLVLFFRE